MKAKKIAFLWEDLAWTHMWRKGIDYMKPPTWEEVAKQKVCKPYANTKKRFYKGEICCGEFKT